jgi:hypothetical protein
VLVGDSVEARRLLMDQVGRLSPPLIRASKRWSTPAVGITIGLRQLGYVPTSGSASR